jgi:hypothetical protein
MSPASANTDILSPALALLPAAMDTHAARVMLLAIGLQESGFAHRQQIGGPARGFWQFERGGGVTGVLTHRATHVLAAHVCDRLGVDPTPTAVYAALPINDLLACAFARLLLYTDPHPLPTNAAGGWDCYARTWRPGKPHRKAWDINYQHAEALA